MAYKPEEIEQLVITGEGATSLYELMTMQTSSEDLSEMLDIVFEAALWGKGHSGGSDDDDFRKFHYHFGQLRDIKKALKIIDDAVEKLRQDKSSKK